MILINLSEPDAISFYKFQYFFVFNKHFKPDRFYLLKIYTLFMLLQVDLILAFFLDFIVSISNWLNKFFDVIDALIEIHLGLLIDIRDNQLILFLL